MTTDLRSAIAMLEGLRASSPQSWMAYCPIHENPPTGHSRSLSVRIAEDGKALIYCHGGCQYRDILAAMDVTNGTLPAPRLPRLYPRPDRRPIDWTAIMERYASDTPTGQLEALSKGLGVSVMSLSRLGASWAGPYDAWAFPMRDPDGEMVGVRLRNEAGEKWAIKGSRNGVFLPDGIIPDMADLIIVCEGPTTCAALLDLDFYAIGRASCAGQEDLVVEATYRRDVVIVADRDANQAGRLGAERLAERLEGNARSVKVVMPLMGNDARDWLRLGAMHGQVATVMRNARYWRAR